MVDRRRLAQRLPDPEGDYAGFPSYRLASGAPLYRSHRDRAGAPARGAWWFASRPDAGRPHDRPGGGRFDLAAPMGTCYLATTAEAAVRERVGPDLCDQGWVPRELADDAVVSRLHAPGAARLANVSVERAADYLVTAELVATGDYALSRAWADLFAASGFGGVRHAPRFAPGRARGIALFGSAGAPDPSLPGDRDPEPVRTRLERMGVEVVDPPALASVTLVDP